MSSLRVVVIEIKLEANSEAPWLPGVTASKDMALAVTAPTLADVLVPGRTLVETELPLMSHLSQLGTLPPLNLGFERLKIGSTCSSWEVAKVKR